MPIDRLERTRRAYADHTWRRPSDNAAEQLARRAAPDDPDPYAPLRLLLDERRAQMAAEHWNVIEGDP